MSLTTPTVRFAGPYQAFSQFCSSHWKYGAVALITTVVLGVLAPRLMRILINCFHKPQKTWKPRALSPEEAMKKMWRNAQKAILEPIKNPTEKAYVSVKNGYPSIDQSALPPIEAMTSQLANPLGLTRSNNADQGKKSSMEDAHFFQEVKNQGIITGVFNGCGGSDVANFACDEFKKKFVSKFTELKGNIHQVFEVLIDEIHQEAAKNTKWNKMGTTAVICFIDRKTDRVYTATLGDSNAEIYREIGQKRTSIPLSRNSPKVPRAIGHVPENRAVSHKPAITVNHLECEDYLVLASKGLNIVTEPEIIDLLYEHNVKFAPAERLVGYAVNSKKSDENVTAVVVYCK